MKDSNGPLLEYVASIGDPQRAASLFAGDGTYELPFLRSVGVQAQLPNGVADIEPPGDDVYSF